MKNLLFTLLFVTAFSSAQCWQAVDVGSNHTLAIKNDGTLWSWGSNNYYKLGYSTTSGTIPFPNRVGTYSNWQSVSAGEWHSAGIKTDGTLWTWGFNAYGQGGQGTSGNLNAFLNISQVGTETNWQSVSVGTNYTLAIKTNGTLWGMGTNEKGELGIGSATFSSQPIQIGTDNNWKQITSNSGYSVGIKTDGSLWAWGTGFLGNGGYITTSNIPLQIGSDIDWNKIAKSGNFVIKNDGTLWAWGYNQFGQLGDGTTINRQIPTQIGNNTNWLSVSCYYNNTLAVKTDGTLWAWGFNYHGELGNGSAINSNVPIQIGTGTNWDSISTGEWCSAAIKSDGTLFSWGYNADGRLGNGTTDNKSIPTPISCSPLSTANFSNNLFTVYPNPTAAVLTIQNEGNLPIQHIAIIDQLGKVVLEQTNDFTTVNLASLQNGLYMLQITTDREKLVYKVVKSN